MKKRVIGLMWLSLAFFEFLRRYGGGRNAVYAGKWHVNGRDVAKSFDLICGKPVGKAD